MSALQNHITNDRVDFLPFDFEMTPMFEVDGNHVPMDYTLFMVTLPQVPMRCLEYALKNGARWRVLDEDGHSMLCFALYDGKFEEFPVLCKILNDIGDLREEDLLVTLSNTGSNEMRHNAADAMLCKYFPTPDLQTCAKMVGHAARPYFDNRLLAAAEAAGEAKVREYLQRPYLYTYLRELLTGWLEKPSEWTRVGGRLVRS